MKSEDFETQIQRQNFRNIPDGWRAEILAGAKAAGENTSTTRSAPNTFIHSLSAILWPCPQAWAGLAAVWLVLLVVNFASDGKPQTMAVKESPPTPQVTLALKEQERLMAKLIEPFDEPLAEPPKPFVPRPRSECEPTVAMS